MRRTIVATLLALGMLGAVPIASFADTCHNVSRAPAAPFTQDGDWIYLPVGFVYANSPAAWYFAPPGSAVAQAVGFPDANGNYTNGKTGSLLGVSANCTGTTSRQTDHGIQSGCD